MIEMMDMMDTCNNQNSIENSLFVVKTKAFNNTFLWLAKNLSL